MMMYKNWGASPPPNGANGTTSEIQSSFRNSDDDMAVTSEFLRLICISGIAPLAPLGGRSHPRSHTLHKFSWLGESGFGSGGSRPPQHKIRFLILTVRFPRQAGLGKSIANPRPICLKCSIDVCNCWYMLIIRRHFLVENWSIRAKTVQKSTFKTSKR